MPAELLLLIWNHLKSISANEVKNNLLTNIITYRIIAHKFVNWLDFYLHCTCDKKTIAMGDFRG